MSCLTITGAKILDALCVVLFMKQFIEVTRNLNNYCRHKRIKKMGKGLRSLHHNPKQTFWLNHNILNNHQCLQSEDHENSFA
mmetsp:Transcript_9411/g.19192  ORF Transcript_9411/g.19192 Transcript_9411/m.19192 type:complete len:82 (+) Transcript_9411:2414-2659(+)